MHELSGLGLVDDPHCSTAIFSLFWPFGHSIKDLLEAHTPPGGRLGRGHKGLYDTINNSIHFQLGLALASFLHRLL